MPGFLADPDLRFDAIVSVIIAALDHNWNRPVAHAWACYPDRAEHVRLVIEEQRIPERTILTEDNQ